MSGKRVAILGCGYVGMALAKAFLKEGYSVIALTRNLDRIQELSEIGAQTVSARLDSQDWLEQIDPNIEIVIDCVSAAESTDDGYQASYYNGLQSILEWRNKGARAGLFLYTSSTSVYPQTQGEWVNEESVVYEGEFRKTQILLESEQLALTQGVDVFERVGVLRLSGIYGPGRHYIIDQLIRGETVFGGGGDAWLNLIHLDDIVSAILAMLKHSEKVDGIYNLSDDTKYTKKQIVEWTAEYLGKEKPEFDSSMGSSRRAFLPNGEMPNRRVSNRKFKEAFGWEPNYPCFQKAYRELIG
jgi:nucleoside-diphosphate-sugar epimerase